METVINGMRPIHPGEVLREEFLLPLEMSASALAIALHVPAPRIHEVLHERRSVTADTALRLERFFGASAAFWLGLQSDYDMALTRAKMGDDLTRIHPCDLAAAAHHP